MTVRELIEQLRDVNPEAEVRFYFDFDYFDGTDNEGSTSVQNVDCWEAPWSAERVILS